MANLFLNLPMPAGEGPGASVNTSAMGKDKSIVVGGSFERASVTIEVSTNGVDFETIWLFDAPGKKVLEVAAQFMRVNVQGRSAEPFSAVADLGANDNGALFVNLVPPVGNGVGAAVNVAALGNFTTFVVSGAFLEASVSVEISEDGVTFIQCSRSFSDIGGVCSRVVVGNFMRVRVGGRDGNSFPFAPIISVGATNDASAGGGGVSDAVVDSFIFQPGGGGTGPVVFEDWVVLDTAKEASRLLGGPAPGGEFKIQVDSSIVSPAVVPPGFYDFTNCTLSGLNTSSRLDLADGVSCIGLRRIERNLGIRNLNTLLPVDTTLMDGDVVDIGKNCFVNSVTTPVWSTQSAGFFGVLLGLDAAINFNFGPGSGSAVVVETLDPTSFLVIDAPNATLPSNGISGGGLVVYRSDDMQAFPDSVIPGLGFRILKKPASVLPNPFLGTPSSASVTASHGEWLRLDTSAGPIVQTLPGIAGTNPYKRMGVFLAVSDAGSSSQGLTLVPALGDTINGLPSFIVPSLGGVVLLGDGVNNWSVLATASTDANPIVKAQRWIVASPGILDVVIPIPGAPMPSDNYVVTAHVTNTVLGIPGTNAPEVLLTDRTTTEFRLSLSAALSIGDAMDFVIVERDPSEDFLGPAPPSIPEFIDVSDNSDAPIPARTKHTITKLADGRMLIAGGDLTSFSSDYTTLCFLYDPVNDLWTSTGPLNIARGNHSAVLLSDGRVLVCGGNIVGSLVTATCEIFDPLTGLWVLVSDMPTAIQDSLSLFLITSGPFTGNVLAACGNTSAFTVNDSNIYDVGTDTWGENATATSFHRSHADVQLVDGRVILFGGLSNEGGGAPGSQVKVTIWDPATNTWSAGSDLPSPRVNAGLGVLPSGNVILVCGVDSTGGPSTSLASTVVYNPVSDTYLVGPNSSLPRDGSITVSLGDGTVLVSGGLGVFPAITSTTEIYDEGTDAFTPGPDRLFPNFGPKFAQIDAPLGGVFIFGGELLGPFIAVASAERYSP